MVIVMNVVGARPQFIKAGPVSKALSAEGVDEILVHTGQHYDYLMSEQIMRDIGLRQPDINLGVGLASHGEQTARILEGVEKIAKILTLLGLELHPDKTKVVDLAEGREGFDFLVATRGRTA